MPCVAIPSPTYLPASRIIAAITNDSPAAVVTSAGHEFITGEIVRIYIPERYGMNELNHRVGTITVTGDTTFTIDVDTTALTAFSIPATAFQCAYIVPIGEVNSLLSGATQNILRSRARS